MVWRSKVRLQAWSAGSGWDASAGVRSRWDRDGNRRSCEERRLQLEHLHTGHCGWRRPSALTFLTWNSGLWIWSLFILDGQMPQRMMGKRVQERRAADAQTDTSHTDAQGVWGKENTVIETLEGLKVNMSLLLVLWMKSHLSIKVQLLTCSHWGSSWSTLTDVVQYGVGTTVRSVRLTGDTEVGHGVRTELIRTSRLWQDTESHPVCVSGVWTGEDVHQQVALSLHWSSSFIIDSTVCTTGRTFMTLMDLRKKFKKCISTVHRQGSLSSRNTEFELVLCCWCVRILKVYLCRFGLLPWVRRFCLSCTDGGEECVPAQR